MEKIDTIRKKKNDRNMVLSHFVSWRKIVIAGLKFQIGRDVSCYWKEGVLPEKSLGYFPKWLALNTE